MKKRTRGTQPIARCGKCGGEDCAFVATFDKVRGCPSAVLRAVTDTESLDIMPAAMIVHRAEWAYEITCTNCDWRWRQLVRETEHIKVPLPWWAKLLLFALVFSIMAVAAGVLLNLAVVKGW